MRVKRAPGEREREARAFIEIHHKLSLYLIVNVIAATAPLSRLLYNNSEADEIHIL